MPVKVATIVGARPQFVKAAIVSRTLREASGIQEIFVHTGQHFDQKMSEVFFSELEMPAVDYFLGINSGSHGRQTGRMLEAIEEVLLGERPQAVMVYGDTNSTLAGALAAVKLHIPVIHVEAGLRSFNRIMPEEINRVMTDHIAEWLFTPTETASAHLRREGIPESKIFEAGDVMYDAALYYGEKAEKTSDVLKLLGIAPGQYVLATVHRAENTNDSERLRAIIEGLCQVAKEMPVVMPLHPRTRLALQALEIKDDELKRLQVIDPVGYLDMVMLEKNASLIATDSGGVQKEAFFYRVPCATLRTETEWTELVEMGWNHLVSADSKDMVSQGILAVLGSKGKEGNPYGTGNAVAKIVQELERSFRARGDLIEHHVY